MVVWVQADLNIIQILHFDLFHLFVNFCHCLDPIVMNAFDPAMEWDMFDVLLALNNSFCTAVPSFEIVHTLKC